jgi:peptidylprolyl isomerase
MTKNVPNIGLAAFLWLSASHLGCGASDDPENGALTDSEATEGTAAPDDVAAPPADAEVSASGLASKLLEEGTGGVHPGPRSRVRVHYSGWQTDGRLFDTSRDNGVPAEFGLDGVIEGWTEGLQLMVEGEKRRLWIPEELAYAGAPNRPSGMLVFDVELLAILSN